MPKSLIVPVGRLFIRARDFAIIRMNYNYILNPKKSNSTDYQIFSKVMGSGIMFSIDAIYQEINENIYLSYLKTQHYTSTSRDDRVKRSEASDRVYNVLTREFLVNEVVTDNRSVDSLINKFDWGMELNTPENKYDEEFWGKFNTTFETETERNLRKQLEEKANFKND